MSSWSHSALFIGDALLRRDPATRAEIQRRFGRESRYLIVEALVDKGVVVSPLRQVRRLQHPHLPADRAAAGRSARSCSDYVIARIGSHVRPPQLLRPDALPAAVPPDSRRDLREDALHFGSGIATETICSTLLAEAFAAVRFPILPVPVRRKRRARGRALRQQLLGRPTRRAYSGLLRARHPTLCVPRDFDLSPYFDIVKFNARELADVRLPQAAVGGGAGAPRDAAPGAAGGAEPGTARRVYCSRPVRPPERMPLTTRRAARAPGAAARPRRRPPRSGRCRPGTRTAAPRRGPRASARACRRGRRASTPGDGSPSSRTRK